MLTAAQWHGVACLALLALAVVARRKIAQRRREAELRAMVERRLGELAQQGRARTAAFPNTTTPPLRTVAPKTSTL